MDDLEKLRNSFKEFSKVKKQYEDFGTCDDEFDDTFWGLMKNFFNLNLSMPDSALDWGIYYKMEGSDKVAIELTYSISKISKAIQNSRYCDVIKFKEELRI